MDRDWCSFRTTVLRGGGCVQTSEHSLIGFNAVNFELEVAAVLGDDPDDVLRNPDRDSRLDFERYMDVCANDAAKAGEDLIRDPFGVYAYSGPVKLDGPLVPSRLLGRRGGAPSSLQSTSPVDRGAPGSTSPTWDSALDPPIGASSLAEQERCPTEQGARQEWRLQGMLLSH